MIKRVFVLIIFLSLSSLVYGSGFRPSGKPKPPLEVSIVKVTEVGGTVELMVEVKALTEASEVQITVNLAGGAEFVTGEREWRGPLSKGGERRFTLFVRPSKKGKGVVKATAEFSETESISYRSMAIYRFGKASDHDGEPKGAGKKGGLGQDIIEYRVK